MKGIQVRDSERTPSRSLTWLLEPIKTYLDQCWWYLGNAGVNVMPPLPQSVADAVFNAVRHRQPIPKPPQSWCDDLDAAVAEYERWSDDNTKYRVGIPGWFSRYADHVDTDWAIYFASDDPSDELPRATMDALDRFGGDFGDWFGHADAWNLPRDIPFICRDVDNAYWDFFFRDDFLLDEVRIRLMSLPGITVQELSRETQ